MIYSDFQGLKLSMLGMGTMRLPVIDGDDSRIEPEETQRMVDYAMANGVNYYDTAWGYHGGNSEIMVGKALSKYKREDYYLTTKFPGYDLSNMPKAEEIFEKQLEKCGVDYFDFYLIHNVCELNIDEYLNPAHKIKEYFVEQKIKGRIRHLGFSMHGGNDVLKRFMSHYGDAMEFCQLQLNYIDWDFQDARTKVAMMKEAGIPIWVMEPMRGGRLTSLSEAEYGPLKALRPEYSQAEWAFRFLQSVPEVSVVLTGASSLEQIKENVRIFEEKKPLTDQEMQALAEMGNKIISDKTVPCTACRYCTSHCPQELDIPDLLKLYNEHVFTGGGFIAPMALAAIPREKRPAACIGCRSCESVCPQQIRISEVLADFTQKLKAGR